MTTDSSPFVTLEYFCAIVFMDSDVTRDGLAPLSINNWNIVSFPRYTAKDKGTNPFYKTNNILYY
jgi:hypothetical protein